MDRRSERAKPGSGETRAPGHPQLHIGGSDGGGTEALQTQCLCWPVGQVSRLRSQLCGLGTFCLHPQLRSQITLRLWVPLEAVCGHVFYRCEIWGPYTPHLLAPGKP